MCRACLTAYLINSAQIYVEQNGLNQNDMFNAFVEAVEYLNDEQDFEEPYEDIELVTVAVH